MLNKQWTAIVIKLLRLGINFQKESGLTLLPGFQEAVNSAHFGLTEIILREIILILMKDFSNENK